MQTSPWYRLWERNPSLKPEALAWAPTGTLYFDASDQCEYATEYAGYLLNGVPCEDDVAAVHCREAAIAWLLEHAPEELWLRVRTGPWPAFYTLEQKLFEVCSVGAMKKCELAGAIV